MIKLYKPNLSRRVKLFLAAGVIVAGTSTIVAFNALRPTSADVMSPTDVKVNEHEARITKVEGDIADTNGRVGQVEQKADDNAKAIEGTQERVVIVEQKAAATPTQPAATSTPESVPAPAPQLDPYTVTDLQLGGTANMGTNTSDHTCTFILSNGERYFIKTTLPAGQNYRCPYQIGDVLSATARSSYIKL